MEGVILLDCLRDVNSCLALSYAATHALLSIEKYSRKPNGIFNNCG